MIIFQDDLARLFCKSQQLLINELLNFGLEMVENFCGVPHVSCMAFAHGIRIMLMMVGKLGRFDLLGHNCPIMNQNRKQIRIRYWNWIKAGTSPLLIIVPLVIFLLLLFIDALSGILIWQKILVLGINRQTICSCILDFTRLQSILNSFINHNLI